MSAHVNGTASKNDLKQVKQYLENIDPEKVEKTYGRGKYTPWHGDGKSQSRTNITFQTKSMYTSGQPPKYITIVAQKRKTVAYVTYESSTWSETTKTIIDNMIKAIEVKNKDGRREATTEPPIMPMEPSQRSGHPRSDLGVNLGEPSRLISKEAGINLGEPSSGLISKEAGVNLGEPSRLISEEAGINLGEPSSGLISKEAGVNLGEPSRLISEEAGINLGEPSSGLISKEAGVNLGEPSGHGGTSSEGVRYDKTV